MLLVGIMGIKKPRIILGFLRYRQKPDL